MPARHRILSLFGTRPEVIKLAPVVHALERRGAEFEAINLNTGQHGDLARPMARVFDIRIDRDLEIARSGQTPTQVCYRAIRALEPALQEIRPAAILVQGDTTTALAGALAGFYADIPVGHVEAGMRTDDPLSPFPEEMNRRLIGRLARFHFAATARNRDSLLAEQVADEQIAVTGNPVVDALHFARERALPSPELAQIVANAQGARLLVVTTHRRESFGETMRGRLECLARFVADHPDVELVFPVHPNPQVREPAEAMLGNRERIHLTGPLDYLEFVWLLSRTWLVASDSGGIQEEAPSLGVPVLVMRENTERPEALAAGVSRLVGHDPRALDEALRECARDDSWTRNVGETPNPFGQGDAGLRIVDALARWLAPPAGKT